MNMKFVALAALGSLTLLTAGPQAMAADNGFYVGAGITQTEFDIDGLGSGELDDSSFKLIGGFRPLDWLAVEANYIDLGGDEEGGESLETSAITVSALGIWEIGVIDLYARAGFAKWDADFDFGGGDDISDDGWEPTYGVGIGAHFGSIGARLEYETFTADLFDELETDISTISLSVTYTFL